MVVSKLVFFAYLAWLGIGIVLTVVIATFGITPSGARGRLGAGFGAVISIGLWALLFWLNPEDGIYRVAPYLLFLGSILPLLAVWDMVRAHKARTTEER